MSPVSQEKIRQIAADVLELPVAKVNAQSSTENVDSWDSVHHLNLVLALEQEFGLQFEPEEIDQMTSIERIMTVLSAKLG